MLQNTARRKTKQSAANTKDRVNDFSIGYCGVAHGLEELTPVCDS